MTDWLKEAHEIKEELKALRRQLHRFPETGNQELKTTETIEAYLKELGIETKRPLQTGVIGILKGTKEGRTAAFRSDIDALPVTEQTGLPFASENEGVMHACGHDFHMTALLGAAKLLAKHRDELPGSVIFIFQPDEEESGGAERLIEAGVIDEADAVFGCHVNPDLKAGEIGIKYGPFYAAAAKYDVTVHGRQSHGAEPEKGIDALYAAALMCTKLKTLCGDYDGKKAVVTTGTLVSGKARNIISDEAHFTGIIRTSDRALREVMKEKVEAVIEETDKITGTKSDADIYDGYCGIVNHDRETEFVQRCAEELLGTENVTVLNEGTLTSEDFGFYLLKKPGSFYHLGVQSEAGLHSPLFDPDESALAKGAALHAYVLWQYLNKGTH
ncbi:MAG: amidohydrolase [Solobacterium sp.]|nr:amidohydrolase [Solobacterium sp.]